MQYIYNHAQMYLQLPVVLSSWKVNIGENPIAMIFMNALLMF